METITKKWAELQPEHKRRAIIILIVFAVIVVGGLGYKMSRSSKPVQTVKDEKKEIALDKSILEKSLYSEAQKEKGKAEEEIKDIKKQLDEIKKEKEKELAAAKEKELKEGATQKASGKGGMPPLPALPQLGQAGAYSVPPPPGMPPGSPGMSQPQKESETVMGGIEVVSGNISDNKKDKPDDDKKKEEIVYLPPSFMEAMLLSGLDAPTAEGAKGHPVPVLLRVKDLAVLPNKVKADLKGCFVIAEGTGNLANERAELRIVSLSCLSKKGKSVIDQKLKGFVIDADGKIGLKGRVVSKMGQHIARSLIAGFFGGIGDAVRQSTMTQNITALGTTQSTLSTDMDKIAKAGVGGGISTAASEIQKFYLDLARQTLPVIEVGATKSVTLVISEGADLKIKEVARAK